MDIYKSKKSSFTLIELLVVITVIGLLSSVVLVSLSPTRAKARDSRRKSDIAQIRKALELYYVDNGQYFLSGGAAFLNGGWINLATVAPGNGTCWFISWRNLI